MTGCSSPIADASRNLSVAKRFPGAGFLEYAEGGGLLAYGVNFSELWRRAPIFVDKILKGAKPSTIPVEQVTKFELGLTIPEALLLRADRVID